jgi:hypothetical protein
VKFVVPFSGFVAERKRPSNGLALRKGFMDAATRTSAAKGKTCLLTGAD